MPLSMMISRSAKSDNTQMARVPESVFEFLRGKSFAVAGVSRASTQPANAIYRRLKDCGYEVFAINPNASEVEGVKAYPDLASIPATVDGVVIATHPDVSVDIVRQCSKDKVARVWFHRSFGSGSVSPEATRECEERGLHYVVGGCPLMFCGQVDFAHKCMKWWLQRRGRVPK
jgi:predicted CoA-binding protein